MNIGGQAIELHNFLIECSASTLTIHYANNRSCFYITSVVPGCI